MQLYHDSELGQHEAHTAEAMRFVPTVAILQIVGSVARIFRISDYIF